MKKNTVNFYFLPILFFVFFNTLQTTVIVFLYFHNLNLAAHSDRLRSKNRRLDAHALSRTRDVRVPLSRLGGGDGDSLQQQQNGARSIYTGGYTCKCMQVYVYIPAYTYACVRRERDE